MNFQTLLFNDPSLSELRWIVLPSEAKDLLLNPSKIRPNKLPPFTPKKYSVIESKTRQTIGSYEGENVDLKPSIFDQKTTFSVKKWFENSSETKILVEAPKQNEKSPNLVENGPKIFENKSESEQNCCVDENGVLSCILPQGRRPDPPRPLQAKSRWRPPSKDIFRPFLEAVEKFGMIKDGDRVLVCLSGGKDSLTLLHTMRQFQIYAAKSNGIRFDLGALTVDPQSAAYDPRPLIPYLAELGLTYLYESQNIMEQVKTVKTISIFYKFRV